MFGVRVRILKTELALWLGFRVSDRVKYVGAYIREGNFRGGCPGSNVQE